MSKISLLMLWICTKKIHVSINLPIGFDCDELTDRKQINKNWHPLCLLISKFSINRLQGRICESFNHLSISILFFKSNVCRSWGIFRIKLWKDNSDNKKRSKEGSNNKFYWTNKTNIGFKIKPKKKAQNYFGPFFNLH